MTFVFIGVFVLLLFAVWQWERLTNPTVWIDQMTRHFEKLQRALGGLIVASMDMEKALGGLGLTAPVEPGDANPEELNDERG